MPAPIYLGEITTDALTSNHPTIKLVYDYLMLNPQNVFYNKLPGEVEQYQHEFTVGQQKYYFTLSDTLIRRKKASDPNELRFEILSSKQPFASGGQAMLFALEGTLAPNKSDKSFSMSKKKSRVVKRFQSLGEGEKFIDNIQKEVELTKNLPYMGIKDTIYSGIPDDPRVYVVMKKITWKTLDKIINDDSMAKNPLTPLQRIDIQIQILFALQALHENILHFDLKPENMFYVEEASHAELGNAKNPHQILIFDLGLGQYLDEKKSFTSARGTIPYAPKEQLQETGYPPDEKSDVYATGVMLAELFQLIKAEDNEQYKGPRGMKTYLAKDQPLILHSDEAFQTLMAGLSDDVKRKIIDLVKAATNFNDPSKRPTVDMMLSACQEIKLAIELQQLTYANQADPKQTAILTTAHHEGIAARIAYRNAMSAAPADRQLVKDIIKNYLDLVRDEKPAITTFVDRLGIRAFSGLTTKAEIISKLDSIYKKNDALMSTLAAIAENIDNSKIKASYVLGQTFDPSTIRQRLSEIDQAKYKLSLITDKKSKENNSLDELETITNKLQTKLDSDPVLSHFAAKNESFSLKGYIQAAILTYIENNTAGLTKGRIEDIQKIMTVFSSHADDEGQQLTAIKKALNEMKKGAFKTSHPLFAKVGGSRFKHQVKEAISDYESNKPTAMIGKGMRPK